MGVCPKSAWGAVKALLHSVYDQPDAKAVHAQWDKMLDTLTRKLPDVVDHLDGARADVLAFTTFPKELWRQVWSNNPNVILSPEEGVVDGADGVDRSPMVRAGRAYLQPSSRHGRGRFGVRCTGGGVRLAA